MNFHLEGQIVQVTVPFTDNAGVQVTPTAVTAILYDGEEVEISDLGPIAFDGGAGQVVVTILGLLNMLRGDEPKEARRLEVKITHAAGVTTKNLIYGIEDERSLVLMQNSFQTYEAALVNVSNMVNLTAFTTATEARQKAALIEAFDRISSIAMVYVTRDTEGLITGEHRLYAEEWEEVDADVFRTQFPSHFQRALRLAQILEADELLQGNVIARKHSQGIATETVGESSVTLRAGFGLQSLSAAARSVLSGYIDTTVALARAS